MNFNRIQAAEKKLWDFSAYFWNTPRILIKLKIRCVLFKYHRRTLFIINHIALDVINLNLYTRQTYKEKVFNHITYRSKKYPKIRN